VNDRATAPALTYVLAIGITTILVSGLLISSTGFVDERRQQTVREELETVGERIAASVAAVDAASDDGANVSRRMEVPARVVDTRYYLSVVDCPAGNVCLELRTADPTFDTSVSVPIDNRSTISIDRARPGSITVVATPGTDPPTTADADVSIDPNIGVARDVDAAFESGGAILGADRSLVVSGFDYRPSPPAATESVTFEAEVGGSGAGNLTYRWDFDGDGTFDVTGNATTAKTVSHTYSEPGRYHVQLFVEDAAGTNDSVSRLLRISGLVFDGGKSVTNPDTNAESAGVEFKIRNNFTTRDVTITEVLIDPEDDAIEGLDNGYATEIEIDGTPVYDNYLAIEDSGSIADFGSTVTVVNGDSVTVEMGEFYDSGGQFDMTGQNVTVAFRYEIDGTRQNFVSEFDINTGLGGGGGGGSGDAPVIERVDTYTFGGDLRAYLELRDDDADMDRVEVEVLDDDGDVLRTASADLSPYGDEAQGYLPLGEYEGDADSIRVTVTDDTGDATTTTESVTIFP
jgi:PKD repeat protein